MASLSIPAQLARGLTIMATLPEESFQELLSALEAIPLRIKQNALVDDSSLKVDSIPADQLSSIKEALFPLVMGYSSSTTPVSDYVESIADSLKEQPQENGNGEYSEETLSQFKERFAQLLNLKQLRLVTKARNVLLKHAQTFTNARIVSDIRPIFGEDVEDPTAAVIVHMFNIGYYSEGERRNFVVALDTKDIEHLTKLLDRAQKKTAKLESIITSADLTYIEVV